MDDFGRWFRKSAEQAADRISGRDGASGAEKVAGDKALTGQDPASPGGRVSDVELVTGTSGTGVRTGDEDMYDSFRPGGREL